MRKKKKSETRADGTTLLILYSERKIANTALNLKGENQSGLKQVGVRKMSFAFKFYFYLSLDFLPFIFNDCHSSPVCSERSEESCSLDVPA